MKIMWLVAGLALTALAVIGALLPVMPSTVFALGAAGCFARSSTRLERWLLANRWLGPSVVAWRTHRAIGRRAKVVAIASMAASGITVALTAPPGVAVVVLVVLTASAAFVASRPSDTSRHMENEHAC